MDGSRFDDLTKALATGRPRRAVLKGLGVGAVALVAKALGAPAASANHGGSHGGGPKPGRCGLPGHPCKFGTQCCSGTCLNGYCACPDGETLCNGTCVNLSSDANNCGSCGNTCNGTTSTTATVGLQCINGECDCPTEGFTESMCAHCDANAPSCDRTTFTMFAHACCPTGEPTSVSCPHEGPPQASCESL